MKNHPDTAFLRGSIDAALTVGPADIQGVFVDISNKTPHWRPRSRCVVVPCTDHLALPHEIFHAVCETAFRGRHVPAVVVEMCCELFRRVIDPNRAHGLTALLARYEDPRRVRLYHGADRLAEAVTLHTRINDLETFRRWFIDYRQNHTLPIAA